MDNPLAKLNAYELRHLTAHLKNAGRAADLHALLRLDWSRTEDVPMDEKRTQGVLGYFRGKEEPRQRSWSENAWYAAREQTGDYLLDVRLAWQVAETTSANGIKLGEQAASVGLEIRYALITASITSLAQNLPTAFVLALVEKRVWTVAQGLAYVRRRVDPDERAQLLLGFLPSLHEAEKAEVVQEAVATAGLMRNDLARHEALEKLAPFLQEWQVRQLLAKERSGSSSYEGMELRALSARLAALGYVEEALERARSISITRSWWSGLPDIAAYMSESQVHEALSELQPRGLRPEILASLVKRLAVLRHVEEAMEIAKNFEFEVHRALALVELAPYLSEYERLHALLIIRLLSDEDTRRKTLMRMIPSLPEPQQIGVSREVLRAVQSIPSDIWRTKGLIDLVPFLHPSVLNETLPIARSITDGVLRAEALANLAASFPEPDKTNIFREALEAAPKIDDKNLYSHPLILSPLAAFDPARTLAVVMTIEYEHSRDKVLDLIARYLPDAQLREALAVLTKINDGDARALLIGGLAPYLPETLLHEALKALKEMQDAIRQTWRGKLNLGGLHEKFEEARAELTGRLAARSDVDEALAAARQIKDEQGRALTIVRLAPHLSGTRQRELLAIARSMSNPNLRLTTLAELLPFLPEAERESVVREILKDLQKTYEREYERVVKQVAPHLPEALLQEVLVSTRTIKEDNRRGKLLAALAPYLSEAQVREALAIAQTTRSLESYGDLNNSAYSAWQNQFNWQGYTQMALVSRLMDSGHAEEALTTFQAIKEENWRFQTLVAIAPRIPDALLPQFLATAQAIKYRHYRAVAVAPLTSSLPPEEKAKVLRELLEGLEQEPNDNFQSEDLEKIAPYLTEDLLAKALQIVRAIKKSESEVAKALTGLSPYLSPSLQSEALAIAQAMRPGKDQVLAWAALIPHLPEDSARLDVLANALSAASSLQYQSDRVETLTSLVSMLQQLPPATRYFAWQKTLNALSSYSRADLLATIRILVPIAATLAGPEGIGEIFKSILDVGSWWP